MITTQEELEERGAWVYPAGQAYREMGCDIVVAHDGDLVLADYGSHVIALRGSQVIAHDGSWVIAARGSHVDACDGSHVFADADGEVTGFES